MSSFTPQISLYGQGFAFPFQFDASTGGVMVASGLPLLQQDIMFLLGTYLGERIMRPTWGSKINRVLFQMNTPEQYAVLKTYIATALQQEPRVQKLTGVQLGPDPADPNTLRVLVSYLPIQQTTPQNLVLSLTNS